MKLVLFDCDGVLINSEEVVYEAQRAFIASYGLVYDDHEFHELLSGRSYEDLMVRLNADYQKLYGAKLPEDFAAKQRAHYLTILHREMRVIDGVHALLADLRRAGVPFCVASNSDRAGLDDKLKRTGLYNEFYPHIFSKNDVKNPKPAPDLYIYAARKMGATGPQNCVVVEDSAVGATAGAAAGMYVVGYSGGKHRPVNAGQILVAAGAAVTAGHMDGVKTHLFKALAITPPPQPGRQRGGPKPPGL